MLRKHRAAKRDSNDFLKSHQSSSGASRRSRIIHALGITTVDRTQDGSGSRTVVDGGEGASRGNFTRKESLESQKPDPRIWTTVEKVDAAVPDEVNLKPGMKKTTWNVRR
jgi:hypothetical protein